MAIKCPTNSILYIMLYEDRNIIQITGVENNSHQSYLIDILRHTGVIEIICALNYYPQINYNNFIDLRQQFD